MNRSTLVLSACSLLGFSWSAFAADPLPATAATTVAPQAPAAPDYDRMLVTGGVVMPLSAGILVFPATDIVSPVPPGSFLGMTCHLHTPPHMVGDHHANVTLLDAQGKAVWKDPWPVQLLGDTNANGGGLAYLGKRALPITIPAGTYRIAVSPSRDDKQAISMMGNGHGVDSDLSNGFIIGTVTIDSKAAYPAADSDAKPTLDLSGMTKTFDEDFSKPLDVSPWGPVGPAPGTRWIAHTPWKGDFGDARFVDPEPGFPFTITPDHHLQIEAKKGADGKWTAGLLASMDPNGVGFGQTYGYFECKAKLPAGNGVWPAFWLIEPRAGDPSTSVEIDILEHYGRNPNAYSATIHTWKPAPHRAVSVQIQTRPGQVAGGFHTYGAMVERDFITSYFDGVAVWKTPTPPEHHKPLMLLVNLALGPGWPVDPTATSFVMEVAYIRAYAKPGDEPPPPSVPATASTTPATSANPTPAK